VARKIVHRRVRNSRVLRLANVGRELLNHAGLVLILLVLCAMTAWSHWPTIVSLVRCWKTNEDYSAGQLVPLVVAFLIWRERKALSRCAVAPCWLGGLCLVALAETVRLYGLLSFRFSLERYAFVVAVFGLVLTVAGRQVVRRVVWMLFFLFLMFPLPGRIQDTISSPLQGVATSGAVFLLEAFGAPVAQEGNIVILNDNVRVAVAEACSGLRMLTAFVIVAAFIAYMVKRSKWRKAVLLFSSIPVAVVCNIIRIFFTAMIMLHVSVELGEKFFHDLAGLVMMPTAVSLLFGELWLMDKLFESSQDSSPQQQKVIRAKRHQHASARAVGT